MKSLRPAFRSLRRLRRTSPQRSVCVRHIGTLQETILRRSVDSVLYDVTIEDSLNPHLPRPRFEIPSHLRQSRTTQTELLEGCLPYESADPFLLVKKESSALSNNIKELLGSDHPVLSTVANYFFNVDGGKKMRPVLVLLFAKAAAFHRSVEKGGADSGATKQHEQGKDCVNLRLRFNENEESLLF